MNRTALKNRDDALDIIEHVNQDHLSEILDIVSSTHPEKKPEHAKLLDIYQEGVLCELTADNSAENEALFIPFEIDGTPEEKLFHLAYTHKDKDKSNALEKRRYFTVIEKRQLTSNFVRIKLSTRQALPNDYAGLCFSFHLKTLKKVTHKTKESSKNTRLSHLSKKLSDTFNQFAAKVLPTKIRQKILKKVRKNIRAYTLRSFDKQKIAGKTRYIATIDIFTHHNSPGSQWVKQLTPHDIVFTTGDHPDNHQSLSQGKTILVCDETAYPAAAGILDTWDNPEPPTLLIISQDESDQNYFDDVTFPKGTSITRIICDAKDQANCVIEILDQQTQFDAVWGALEMASAKRIRHFLRNEKKLTGKQNLVKAYWRHGHER